MATTTDRDTELLERLTQIIGDAVRQVSDRLDPSKQTAPLIAEAQRAAFGYQLLGGLLSRRPTRAFEIPAVTASWAESGVCFGTSNLRGGTHAELRAGATYETIAIKTESLPGGGTQHCVSPADIKMGSAIDSILILKGEAGPIVAIGPPLSALPSVEATRTAVEVSFGASSPPDGTHAQLRSGDTSETLAIRAGSEASGRTYYYISPQEIGADEPIESILIIDGETGNVVAIGPPLAALATGPTAP